MDSIENKPEGGKGFGFIILMIGLVIGALAGVKYLADM
jgi:hypothetical protein